MSEKTIRYGSCSIFLRGDKDFSYIEGPSYEAVDDSFDFICAIPIPNAKVKLRLTDEERKRKNPTVMQDHNWEKDLIKSIPLGSMPLVRLADEDIDRIQKEIDTYEKKDQDSTRGAKHND